MINWLIIIFTKWLMVIYYFHSFPNIDIRNPYNDFRLDIFLFLPFYTSIIQVVSFVENNWFSFALFLP